MKRTLVVILAATLTVNFSGVTFATDPAQDVAPGLEKEMKEAPEQKMEEMKEAPEQKMKEDESETDTENALLIPSGCFAYPARPILGTGKSL